MHEYKSGRNPCPFCIVEDCGTAFSMGIIGGSMFQTYKGIRNAPSGFRNRIKGGFVAAVENAPKTGGRFSSFSAIFSSTTCALMAFRKKDDPWNSIISGAMAGGLLTARRGVPTMVGNAIAGGILLSMIEGAMVLFDNQSNQQYSPPVYE